MVRPALLGAICSRWRCQSGSVTTAARIGRTNSTASTIPIAAAELRTIVATPRLREIAISTRYNTEPAAARRVELVAQHQRRVAAVEHVNRWRRPTGVRLEQPTGCQRTENGQAPRHHHRADQHHGLGQQYQYAPRDGGEGAADHPGAVLGADRLHGQHRYHHLAEQHPGQVGSTGSAGSCAGEPVGACRRAERRRPAQNHRQQYIWVDGTLLGRAGCACWMRRPRPAEQRRRRQQPPGWRPSAAAGDTQHQQPGVKVQRGNPCWAGSADGSTRSASAARGTRRPGAVSLQHHRHRRRTPPPSPAGTATPPAPRRSRTAVRAAPATTPWPRGAPRRCAMAAAAANGMRTAAPGGTLNRARDTSPRAQQAPRRASPTTPRGRRRHQLRQHPLTRRPREPSHADPVGIRW